MSILEMRHVKKRFDNLEVLKDISFSVSEGEVVSIIGPSGSGKSTILRCATMLETIDGGSFSYHGENAAWEREDGKVVYASKERLAELKRDFGLVFQNFNLFPHYSVMKNVTDAPINVQKRNKEEVFEEARAILEKMGLSDKEDAYPYQLSGGQSQRVAIARALVNEPIILLADEPTGNLDPNNSWEIMNLLEEVNKNGTTVVVVTHNIEIVKTMKKRVIELRNGEVAGDWINGADDENTDFVV